MIKIKYHYTDEFRRKGFTIKGHADFAPIGQDIVCAAVTSNSIGIINSLDTIAKVKFDAVTGQEGFIECLVNDESLNEKSDLLLEHFELTMKSIQKDYPKNIKILKK
ncbi:MAG: ribosomal-processing cysteine protease Prp [Terrisporobacter sp.]|uniref:ribosomal-processing cysteine protease Prp n=1 Tax=Terrisporobacter sp. TaxID=1965305 RepID=UPI002FC986BD